MADQPYTEADVERIARTALARSGWTMPLEEGMDLVRGVLAELAAAGRLLPEGARANGICGEHAPVLFGAGLDLQVCELTAGHKGWHGRPNGPGEPWMNWTGDMIVSASTDE